MAFNLIDMENWERREYYNHFINEVVCTYSLTVNMDITQLGGTKLYPTMLYLLTDTVNEFKEFRTSLFPDGVGIFESMHPGYTIFNKEAKIFSTVCSEFDKDYNVFLKRYVQDVANFQSSKKLYAQENRPINVFGVSMIPWFTFSSFNLSLFDDGKYLLPVFTMGKTFKDGEKVMISLAIQVHHAVCDGYHVGCFVESLQNKINNFTDKFICTK